MFPGAIMQHLARLKHKTVPSVFLMLYTLQCGIESCSL